MRSPCVWLCCADGAAAPAPAAPRVWQDTDSLSAVIDAVAPADLVAGWKAKLFEEELETVYHWKALSESVMIAKFTARLLGTLNAELNPPAAPAPAPGADFDVRGCGVSVAVRVWVCWTEMAAGLWEMLCRRVPRFALFQPGLLLVFL